MKSVLMRLITLCSLPLLLATTGCSDETRSASKPATGAVALKTSADYFPITIGTEKARIQLALTPGEQQLGLMHRRDLGANDGMIFIYRNPQVMSFWMRNTPSPLDIGFFDENGVLTEVYPLIPFDETSVRSRKSAKYAIEMPRGWYSGHNVQPGSKLDLAALAAAVQARGMKPSQLNIPTK